MTILVGLAAGARGTPPLDLALMLAASTEEDLEIRTIVPTPWPPHLADAEFQSLQESMGRTAQARARAAVEKMAAAGAPVTARFGRSQARSVASGLLDAAQDPSVSSVVLGSSAAVIIGRVALGGIAERVLHSSGLPVWLAPSGYRAAPGSRVQRVTVGFGRADADSDLLASAAALAARSGATLRVACFALSPMTAYAGSIEPQAEDLVVDEWAHQLKPVVDGMLRSARATGRLATTIPVETVVGRGSEWAQVLSDVEWSDGDVLAIGANAHLSGMLLGSHASKIVRHSPVPVLLTPRGAPSA